MPKKKQNVAVKVAVITAIGAIIAAFAGGPFLDTLYKEKPLIDISLGYLGTDLPHDELPKDDKGYYLQFVSRNRGNSDGNIVVTFIGNNAKIWAGNIWEYKKIIPFIIFPDPQPQKTSFYIAPDEGTTSFTIEIIAEDQPEKHQFQKINLINPIKLTYEKTEEGYKRVN